MVDYDKRYHVPSETISTYNFKDGKALVIIRKFVDYLHPRTGAIMKRDLTNVTVTGDCEEYLKEEICKWMASGYKSKIPKAIKKYMEELA
jgi:hypothetical protein